MFPAGLTTHWWWPELTRCTGGRWAASVRVELACRGRVGPASGVTLRHPVRPPPHPAAVVIVSRIHSNYRPSESATDTAAAASGAFTPPRPRDPSPGHVTPIGGAGGGHWWTLARYAQRARPTIRTKLNIFPGVARRWYGAHELNMSVRGLIVDRAAARTSETTAYDSGESVGDRTTLCVGHWAEGALMKNVRKRSPCVIADYYGNHENVMRALRSITYRYLLLRDTRTVSKYIRAFYTDEKVVLSILRSAICVALCAYQWSCLKFVRNRRLSV